MYEWNELKTLWEHGRVTPEQAIGQLILWGEQHHTLTATYQRRQELLEQQVKSLIAQVAALQIPLGRQPGR